MDPLRGNSRLLKGVQLLPRHFFHCKKVRNICVPRRGVGQLSSSPARGIPIASAEKSHEPRRFGRGIHLETSANEESDYNGVNTQKLREGIARTEDNNEGDTTALASSFAAGKAHKEAEAKMIFPETREHIYPPFKRLETEKLISGKRANYFRAKPPQGKDAVSTVEYVKIGNQARFHPIFLRDACTCAICVDPSSKQKNFQTTDIPPNLRATSLNNLPDGRVEIVWENDIPGYGSDHVSSFPSEFFKIHSSPRALLKDRFQAHGRQLWNKKQIAKSLEYVNFDEYMTTDEALFRAVRQLHIHGLLLVRGVPESEKSVEDIATRIGNLRDSLYGRTWDVKSVPQAKNVAYTSQFLGLHMDLLYMANPPGFQFLHCLKNSCDGGSSLFSDSFYAASRLSADSFHKLSSMKVAYHYRNAGEHYYYRHPVIEVSGNPAKAKKERIDHVNFSPPFQANHIATGRHQQDSFPALVDALRDFTGLVEAEENLYEYRLQEGECVIFNNRRVLHGRRQFDTSAGMRWLKGAYIDTDIFMSRFRVLNEKYRHVNRLALDSEGLRVNP